MKWITRERQKIDRVACPWLLAQFIDKEAELIFFPPEVPALRAPVNSCTTRHVSRTR
jgi:hypothetical protein